jgi:hypothetical protein
VKCWGRGSEGELGNGGFVASSTPVNVSGLGSGVLAVSSGTEHTCALTSAGGVKCWGYNFYKQLGNGLDTPSAVPVDVVGLATGITAVEASLSHTCAITTPGGVKCWGYNLNGQLGDNTTTLRGTPVDALIGGQAISFTPPARLLLNLPTALTATASSGLPITFDTWTPSVCSISGNTVTATTRSLCGIRASQAGIGHISAASQSLHLVPVAFTLDVDASVTATKYDAGTDGLLASRYMLGLTGTALTSSALGATAGRIDPDLIRAYLNDGRFLLDIDGNGKLDAFTDGLLIHRYLLGQRGSALTTGAFDPLGTRTSIADIEAHLSSLLP